MSDLDKLIGYMNSALTIGADLEYEKNLQFALDFTVLRGKKAEWWAQEATKEQERLDKERIQEVKRSAAIKDIRARYRKYRKVVSEFIENKQKIMKDTPQGQTRADNAKIKKDKTDLNDLIKDMNKLFL